MTIKKADEKYISKETEEFLGEKFIFDKKHFGGVSTAKETMTVKLLYSPEWEKWLDAMYFTAFTTWDNGNEISLNRISITGSNKRRQLTLDFMKKRPISAAFESAVFVFRIDNVSRSMTAQICRHRKMSFNEMSLRVTPAHHMDFRITDLMDRATVNDLKVLNNEIRNTYIGMIDRGIPIEHARNIIPLGTCTKITMTTNLSALMDYLRARTSDITQDEHTYLVMLILKELKNKAPEFYENFVRHCADIKPKVIYAKDDVFETMMKQYKVFK